MECRKVPKVAYKVLSQSKERGGIGLPGVHSRVKAQQINIITRLVSGVMAPWKIIPSWFLDPYGRIKNDVWSSYDIKRIPPKLPDYYKYCSKQFSEFTSKIPIKKEEILIQPLWNNKNIKIGGKPTFIEELIDVGIYSMKDIWSDQNCFKILSDFTN